MRVMVLAMASEDSEAGVPPTPEAFAAMDRYTEELAEAGIFVAAAGLKRNAESKRVSGDSVSDGPFGGDVIAGFSIWEVKDMAEAVAWAKRNPIPGRLEIRPFLEAGDLADFLSPEELATPRQGARGQLGVA